MTQTTKKRGNNPASRMKIKLDDVNWYPADGARKTRRAGAGHASPSQPQGEGPVARSHSTAKDAGGRQFPERLF